MAIRRLFAAICLGVAAVSCLAPCEAQQASDAPRRLTSETAPGPRLFLPGRWGLVGSAAANPSDKAADLLPAHFFPGDPDLQFARQLWVPGRAKRLSWYPVLPPARAERGTRLPVKSMLLDRSSSRDVLLRDPTGTLIQDGVLSSLRTREPVTGMIADAEDDQSASLVQVARVAMNLSPRLVLFGEDGLPPIIEGLDALDHLVISSDRAAADPAAAIAIRRWLHRGGRLWVQLERVSPATVTLLLGEDFPCSVVDRVGLTRWELSTAANPIDPEHEVFGTSRTQDEKQKPSPEDAGSIDTFEQAVDMVRVVAPGARPVHTIDGWPASFWRRSGRGWVLLTTAGPRAWFHVRPETDKKELDPQNPVAMFRESEALQTLGFSFLKGAEGPPVEAKVFAPLLTGQVGHHIVGRGTVFTILSAFCLALLAGGITLARHGDLAQLGWMGPAAALTTALVLVVIGYVSRSRVPPTAAIAQLVEAAPGNEASVSGLIALYSLGDAAPNLGTEQGGIFLPERQGQEGTTRRMVWTDMDRWHWENLSLAPGLDWAPFETTVTLEQPLSARVTFGSGGAVGKVGGLTTPSDALLALPSSRHLAVRFTDEKGGFASGSGDMLARGQFLASGLVSDEQRRRQAVYQAMLKGGTWPRYPMRPMFLAWTDPLELGFTFMEGARHTGSALTAIPLDIERPAPGTRFTLPAPFLSYYPTVRAGFALLYDAKKDAWVSSLRRPARTMLRFRIPHELLPLRVERAVLEVDVNAPGYPLQILSDNLEVLATRQSPVGKFRFDIDRADLLQPDATGAIHLGLSVGEAGRLPQPGDPSGEWRIEDVQLELSAHIPED